MKIDIFTFSSIKSPVSMQVIGLPASVSPPGYFGREEYSEELLYEIRKREKGLILVLNIPCSRVPGKFILTRMLPGIEIRHEYTSWEDYFAGLRADYRRRIRKILRAFGDMRILKTSCAAFSEKHYNLYLQVWNKSKTRLEKLTFDFFRNLPEEFELISLFTGNTMAAWHIILREENRRVFFFGGTDYALNSSLNAYFNNLLCIVREALEHGCQVIDLGQTAEIPKMRLGGSVVEKNMAIYHHNILARFALRMATPLIAYKRSFPHANVFNQNHGS